MRNSGEQTAFPSGQPPTPRRSAHRWLLFGGIALVLTLTLGISAMLGFTLGVSQTQEATSRLVLAGQAGAAARQMPTREPGTPGSCGGELTVSRVTNRTITVTRPDGSTSTVYVTAHTQYTQQGHAVSVNAVQVGSKIYVVGSCANQGGRINATSIEIAN